MLRLFDAMAEEMNAHPERFSPLGEVELDMVCLMRGDAHDVRVRLVFEGLGCKVLGASEGDERKAECWLDGDLRTWRAMFDDIRTHGAATGQHTLNSLTLLGEPVRLAGADPMGVDKFSRFNQSLQEFFDGAARVQLAAV
jgi:hypothetical protein